MLVFLSLLIALKKTFSVNLLVKTNLERSCHFNFEVRLQSTLLLYATKLLFPFMKMCTVLNLILGRLVCVILLWRQLYLKLTKIMIKKYCFRGILRTILFLHLNPNNNHSILPGILIFTPGYRVSKYRHYFSLWFSFLFLIIYGCRPNF